MDMNLARQDGLVGIRCTETEASDPTLVRLRMSIAITNCIRHARAFYKEDSDDRDTRDH